MRYAASEKLEIIRTVETSHLPVRRTLDKIAIPKTTFYAWLDRYAAGGLDALEDHRPTPRRVWNRIPDGVRERIVQLALDEPDSLPARDRRHLHRPRALVRLGSQRLSPPEGARPRYLASVHRDESI
jgi:transposase-like protein